MPEFSPGAAFEAARRAVETAKKKVEDAVEPAASVVRARGKEIVLGTVLAAGVAKGVEMIRYEQAEENVERATITGPEAERQVHERDWEAHSVSAIEVVVKDQKKKTVYHLVKGLLEQDPVYKKASEEQRADIIDGVIGLTRALNPDVDLDRFNDLVGKKVVFPVAFEWKGGGEVYDKDHGGYGILQKEAEKDGFLVRTGSQQEIFDAALRAAEDVPLKGKGYLLDRVGSEDSPAKLAPDVIGELTELGKGFSSVDMGDGEIGWSFTVTDLIRDPQAQSKRESIKASTHPTGRTFDISDGQWVSPEGERITWTVKDPGTGKNMRGPNADFIEDALRPALLHAMTDRGWLVYAEPTRGHWHVYVPKERHPVNPLAIDLGEEWATYLAKIEKPEPIAVPSAEGIPAISTRIRERFLRETEEAEKGRVTRGVLFAKRDALRRDIEAFFEAKGQKVQRPFLTALKNFPDPTSGEHASSEAPSQEDELSYEAWLKARVIELVRSAQPEDVGDAALLEGMTVHGTSRPPLSDLKGIWKWKEEHVKAKYKPHVAYVAGRIDALNHQSTFREWYRAQAEMQTLVLQHAEELGFSPELVAYTTPEVMIALTQAEFASELDGNTYTRIVPVLFDGYNLVRGPAVNDREMSAGPAQLITGTFLGPGGIMDHHGAATRTLVETNPAFAEIVVPVKDPKTKMYTADSVARAMVLSEKSAMYWSYLSALYHTEAGFAPLIEDPGFKKIWDAGSEGDRLMFVAALTPLANNGGVGRSARAGAYILDHLKGKTLVELASDLRNSTTHPNAARGAREGFDCMEAILTREE